MDMAGSKENSSGGRVSEFLHLRICAACEDFVMRRLSPIGQGLRFGKPIRLESGSWLGRRFGSGAFLGFCQEVRGRGGDATGESRARSGDAAQRRRRQEWDTELPQGRGSLIHAAATWGR